MIRFELKKILKSKMNLIAMLMGFVLLAVVFCSQNFGSDSIYCQEKDTYLYGKEAVSYSKELAAKQGDELSEEVVAKYLKILQDYPDDLNSDDAYVDVIRNNGSMIYYLGYSYSGLTDSMLDFNNLKSIDLTRGTGFYERRIEKIKDYLDMDFSYGNYTEAEKEYWIKKAETVKTPFAWGSKAPGSRMNDLLSCVFFLIAVVIVCVSPVFSKEVDTGAMILLLTTRYGKTRLIKAKVAASVIFSFGYLLLAFTAAAVAQGLTCGWKELALPIQLWGNAIPYALTMWQTCLLNLGIVLVMAFSLTAIMLFVSALTQSTIGTMAFALVLIIVPAFIPYSKNSGVVNHLLDLTYVKFANVTEVMGRFVSYRFGGVILDQMTVSVIVWMLIGAVLLVPLRRVFVERAIR